MSVALIAAHYRAAITIGIVRWKNVLSAEASLFLVLARQERLVEQASRGVLSDDKVKSMMGKLEESEQAQRKLISELESQVEAIPTKDQIDAAAPKVIKVFPKGHRYAGQRHPEPGDMEGEIENSRLGSLENLKRMSFEERRELLRLVFGFSDKRPESTRKIKGRKMQKFVKGGIYVKRTALGAWTYKIRGLMLGMDLTGTIEPLKCENRDRILRTSNDQVGACD
jgi:hypothetical protein